MFAPICGQYAEVQKTFPANIRLLLRSVDQFPAYLTLPWKQPCSVPGHRLPVRCQQLAPWNEQCEEHQNQIFDLLSQRTNHPFGKGGGGAPSLRSLRALFTWLGMLNILYHYNASFPLKCGLCVPNVNKVSLGWLPLPALLFVVLCWCASTPRPPAGQRK